VVAALSRGSMRYREIRRQVDGISQRMLALTLKGLEQDGLVKRTMFPTYSQAPGSVPSPMYSTRWLGTMIFLSSRTTIT
jgi:DNA-binding HxlR family transcriptional regulator